jgi:hypothetical protein
MGNKPTFIPMNLSLQISWWIDNPTMDDNTYQHLLGKLMFLTHNYLDILFFVTFFNH